MTTNIKKDDPETPRALPKGLQENMAEDFRKQMALTT